MDEAWRQLSLTPQARLRCLATLPESEGVSSSTHPVLTQPWHVVGMLQLDGRDDCYMLYDVFQLLF
jgi:hypothetical protein